MRRNWIIKAFRTSHCTMAVIHISISIELRSISGSHAFYQHSENFLTVFSADCLTGGGENVNRQLCNRQLHSFPTSRLLHLWSIAKTAKKDLLSAKVNLMQRESWIVQSSIAFLPDFPAKSFGVSQRPQKGFALSVNFQLSSVIRHPTSVILICSPQLS